MSAKPLTVCPKDLCPKKQWGKGKVQKQLGAGAGLIFKGSGFYITDYRSANYKEGAKKDSSSASSSSSSTPKTESKPAAPAPAKESKSKSSGKKN